MTTYFDRLPSEVYRPETRGRQSRYVEGWCENCQRSIAPGSPVRRRTWVHGPAEVVAHVECPPVTR